MVRQFRMVSIPLIAIFALLAIGLAVALSQATALLIQPTGHHATTQSQPAPIGPAQGGTSSQNHLNQPAGKSVPNSPAPAQAAPVNQSEAAPADRCSAGGMQGGRALPMCAPLAQP